MPVIRNYQLTIDRIADTLRNAQQRREMRADADPRLTATEILAFLSGLELAWLVSRTSPRPKRPPGGWPARSYSSARLDERARPAGTATWPERDAMTIFRGEELVFRRERCCETVAAELDAAALGPGQLLVEARYTLVSQGTELANFTGLDPGTRQPGSWNCYPHRPGYASAGTVVATGPAAGREPRFEPGDQVLAITPHARYGVADPAIRPVTGLRAGDDQRTLILARMAAVAMTAVRKAGSVDLGGRAVVVGLGLVGFFAAQLLRLGGMEVLGLEAAAVRREAAIAAGVRADPPDPVEQVRVHRAERAGDPDLVIEATGSDAGLRLALNLVRDGGEVILLGTPRGRSSSDPVHLMSAIHYRGLRVTGALEWLLPLHGAPWSARWSLNDSYRILTGLLREGTLGLGGWQVRTVRPRDAQAVYRALADQPPRAEAVVFDWDPDRADP